MSDFFSFSDSSLTIKQNAKRLDPVLFKTHPNPDITFVVDEFWSKKDIDNFHKHFIMHDFGRAMINYQILYCFKYLADEKEQSKGMEKFYSKNKIKFEDYIDPYSKVIPIGRAVYAITESTDIKAETFYDYIFNKTYFYAPEIKSNIFPVDFKSMWFRKDCFSNWFMKYQVNRALEDIPFQKRQRPKKRVVIDFPNEFLKQHMGPKKMAWDLETSGFNYQSDRIGDFSVSFDGITGYYLKWKDIDIPTLNEFLKDKFQIGANLKFDVRFLREQGATNATIHFDTLNAGHVLNEMRSNSLKTHAWLYTLHGGYEKPLDQYKLKHKVVSYIDDIPDEVRIPYSIDDSIVTFQVYEKMEAQLVEISNRPMFSGKEWTLRDYFYNSVMPATRAFVKIEMQGMTIDWEKVKEVSDELSGKIEGIVEEIRSLLKIPNDFKITSNVQLGKRLKELNWPPVELTKAGNYAVNESTLGYYKALDPVKYKAAGLIEEMHSLQTLHKTFAGYEHDNSGYFQYKYPDERVHPNFAVMLADSGRNKCKNPNLQNVPKRSDNAKTIRKYFNTPGPEFSITELDGAGFQLRIGAALSGDEVMKDIFVNRGGDMHSITAQGVFRRDVTVEEFIANKGKKGFKEFRFKAKGVNFSLLFGSSGMAFASSSLIPNWTLDEAKEYVYDNKLLAKLQHLKEMQNDKNFDNDFFWYWTVANDIRKKFFETYPGLKAWIDAVPKQAVKDGYVVSPFGCIRRLPQLTYAGEDMNHSKHKNLLNISLNSPVQNYEAFMMMKLISELDKYCEENSLKSYLIGNVHDSIIMYTHKDEEEALFAKAHEIFREAIPANNGVPMELDIDRADYFGKDELWGFGTEI